MIVIYNETEVVKNDDGTFVPKRSLKTLNESEWAGCIYEGKAYIMKTRWAGLSRTLVKIFKSLWYDYQ